MNKRLLIGMGLALLAVIVFGGLLANRLSVFSPDDLILNAERDYTLTDTVDRNVAIFGQSVRLDGSVNGNALLGADNVAITGEVAGDVTVFASNVAFSGAVTGDAVFFAENVTLGGEIDGEVVAMTANLTIDGYEGAVLACAENVTGGSDAAVTRECDRRTAQALISRAGTQLASVWFVSMMSNPRTAQVSSALRLLPLVTFLAGVGALLVTVFPRALNNIETTVRANPWQMLATGGMVTLVMIGTTAAYLLLLAYLIGVALLLSPVYLLMLTLFWLLVAVGWVTLTLSLGNWLSRRLSQTMLPPLVTTVIGGVVLAVVLYGLSWLPLGNLLAMVGFWLMGVAGLGAAYATRLGRRSIIIV